MTVHFTPICCSRMFEIAVGPEHFWVLLMLARRRGRARPHNALMFGIGHSARNISMHSSLGRLMPARCLALPPDGMVREIRHGALGGSGTPRVGRGDGKNRCFLRTRCLAR